MLVTADHNTLTAGDSARSSPSPSPKPSTGFGLGDVTVRGGTLGNLSHVGVDSSGHDVYTATFTPDVTNTEAGSVQVNASSYADVAGNSGAASNTINFTGDTKAPTVSVAADHSALLAGQTAVVTFTFSEAVASFALGDVTVHGGTLASLVHVGVNGAGQDIYTATFTPDAANARGGLDRGQRVQLQRHCRQCRRSQQHGQLQRRYAGADGVGHAQPGHRGAGRRCLRSRPSPSRRLSRASRSAAPPCMAAC